MDGSEKPVGASQEAAFLSGEGDAYARRNAGSASAASAGHPVLAALADVGLADRGSLSNVGGEIAAANPYAHREGLFTYKQDYSACFTSLGIYHPELRRSFETGSAADPDDPYDRRWTTAILRKDLHGRYAPGG